MSPKKQLNLREKRDIGQVVNASFAFLRLSYGKMFRDLILFSTPFYIIAGVCTGILQFDEPAEFAGFATGYLLNPLFYASIVAGMIGTTLCISIVGNYIYQYTETGSNQFDKVGIRQRIWKHLPGLLVVSLFYYAANIGSLVFLIIPGIFFSVANVLSRPIYILENKNDLQSISIGESFSESRRLISDNWWRSFGLFYILFFLVAIMGIIFTLPQIIIRFIISFNAARSMDMEGYRLSYTISSIVSQVGQGLLEPITVTAWFIYYYSLKESKDQTDLMATIENIGVKTTTTSDNEGSY